MPTLPPIPPDWRLPLGLGLVGLCLLTWLVLYLMHRARNDVRGKAGLPTKTLPQHVRTRAGHHVPGLVLAAIGVAILAGVGVGYVLVHHGGARIHHAPLAPPIHRTAGGSGNYTSLDLAASVRPIDQVDQGDSQSCCGWTVVRLDALTRYLRDGELVMPDAPVSGYEL